MVIIGKVKFRAHTINVLKHGSTGKFLESFTDHHYAFYFDKIIFSLETTADLRQSSQVRLMIGPRMMNMLWKWSS